MPRSASHREGLSDRHSRTPLWARCLASFLDAYQRAISLALTARDELLFAALSPRRRQAVTTAIYERQRQYMPGGATFEGGLFDWERRALTTPPFPSAGTILIGGCGGGREVRALRERRYEVVGFDPSGGLVGAARRALDGDGGALHRGSYDDFVRAVEGEPNALRDALRGRHFDGVILGWTSFSYLPDDETRRRLLRATRAIAPDAPVLVSFYPAAAPGAPAPAAPSSSASRRRPSSP
jgi:SAM-dependent methyltransferase